MYPTRGGDPTLWAVLPGRLGEAKCQPLVRWGSVSVRFLATLLREGCVEDLTVACRPPSGELTHAPRTPLVHKLLRVNYLRAGRRWRSMSWEYPPSFSTREGWTLESGRRGGTFKLPAIVEVFNVFSQDWFFSFVEQVIDGGRLSLRGSVHGGV